MANKKKKGGKKKGRKGGKKTVKTGKAKRAKFDEVVTCPCCEKEIRVKAFRNIKVKAVPAVVALEITVEPELQGKLDLDIPPAGTDTEVTEE